jgi:hypothetical protein
MPRGVRDYRVETSWRTSDKRKILESILGRDASLAVVDLWGYCADRRPDGNLSGMSNRAIAVAAGWSGAPDDFIGALTDPDVELLDGEPGSYRIHDWGDHQPWAVGADQRAREAQRKAHRRWRSKGQAHTWTEWCDPDCPGFVPQCPDPTGECPEDVPGQEPNVPNSRCSGEPGSQGAREPGSQGAREPVGAPPRPLAVPIRTEPTTRPWSGDEITSVSDFEAACAQWGWVAAGTMVGRLRGKARRVIDAGAIGAEEWASAKKTTDEKADLGADSRASFFLGCVELDRRQFAAEASKNSPVSKAERRHQRALADAAHQAEVNRLLDEAGVK